MNILIANWVWHQIGGDWTYVNNITNLYRSKGHSIIPFAMKSSNNEDAFGFEKYFIDFVDYKELNSKKSIFNGLKAVSKTVFSAEARKNIELLLREHSVDAAHLNNIQHYITPSILPVLKRNNIPIFWTLHDYSLICPDTLMVSHGKVCEKCIEGAFYNCILNRCKKGSFMASTLAAIENYTHRYSGVFKYVDRFLSPSEFLREKFIQAGFPSDKIVTVGSLLEMREINGERLETEPYILYIGRIEKIKGIFTLLEAMKHVSLSLKIVGGGEELEHVRNYIHENGLQHVELLGHRSREEVYEIVKGASFMVCPSECYENYPYSVIEGMFLEKAIIGANIGGIPEVVSNNITGLLFESGNSIELAGRMNYLKNNIELQKEFGNNAFNIARDKFSHKSHYIKLKNIYQDFNLIL